jgi:hypothetical protein
MGSKWRARRHRSPKDGKNDEKLAFSTGILMIAAAAHCHFGSDLPNSSRLL